MSDDELREELESHIQMLADQFECQGMPRAEALPAARRQFGNRTIIQEQTREVWVNRILENLLTDARLALRGFRRNPAFALTAIIAIALGIGPTTAVFSIIDRLLFRPLPYSEPDRLVSVGMLAPLDTNEFIFADGYRDMRRLEGPFTGVTAFQAGSFGCDLTEQNPRRLDCMRMDANFLPVLGVAPHIGRGFTADEDRPGGPPVALITYGLWMSRYAGDPSIVGRTLPLDGAPVTVIGVLPPRFELPTLATADVFLPIALRDSEHSGRAFRAFARLKPGVSAVQAREQLGPVFAKILDSVPPQFRKEVGFTVRPVRDRQVGDARTASLTLFSSVLAVLLIACANVATLLLARSTSRQRELAMRAALGASRMRLAGQTLTECLMLAATGGILGVGLAWALVRASAALAPNGLPRMSQASIDGRVLLFALAASVVSGLLFGILPAMRQPAARWISGWRSTSRIASGLRVTLAAAQVAISIILLTGAGLLLRSLWNLEHVPLGMDTGHVITAKFALSGKRFPDAATQLAAFSEVERNVAALPGVEASALSDSIPPIGGRRARPLNTIAVEGKVRPTDGTGGMVNWRYVTPGYFNALRIPIVRGRGFAEQDRDPAAQSMILNETFAKAIFGNEDPIGRHVLKDPDTDWFTVIGVARDVRNDGVKKPPAPEYWVVRKTVPDVTWRNQEPPMGWRAASIVVRSSVSTQAVAASLRSVLAQVDPAMPVEIGTLQQRVDGVNQGTRFNAVLLSMFALIGLLLSAVGLYGVIAFLVSQSARDIGVRMALGASPTHIRRHVLLLASRWTLAGSAIGVAGALYASKVVKTMLFGVPERDPWTLIAVVVTLLAAGLLAAWGPGRRAARVDPIEALRQE